jgi:hypothetical protein
MTTRCWRRLLCFLVYIPAVLPIAAGFQNLLTIKNSVNLQSLSSDEILHDEPIPPQPPSLVHFTRTAFFQSLLVFATCAPVQVHAFEGGIGGLGKTKPETGVVVLSDPVSSNGAVSAELLINNGLPVLIGFQTPKNWPLLTGSGLEARDLQTGDSALLQVVENCRMPTSADQMKRVLLDSLLSMKGKFGAYGSPTDIKVKPVTTDTPGLYTVSFTTLTPGQRESERKIFVLEQNMGSSLLLFVVGSNRQRFSSQESTFRNIIDSFQAVPAPLTKLSR